MRTLNTSDSSPEDVLATRDPSNPYLEWRESRRGNKPGDRFVRVTSHKAFERVRPGYLAPRAGTGEPASGAGRLLRRVRRALVGQPIATSQESHERLTKVKALAVFSSDALSSTAYATEEIMKVLVLGGMGLLSLTMPIALAITLLLAIVVLSYRQTIRAYPSGGGSYIVASENLGPLPGLTAAASLLIDYVLTVAVSVAAGVAAMTSLVPALLPYVVEISVGAVLLIMLANLRGIRESGTIFAVPTYLFVVMMYGLLVVGLYKMSSGSLTYTPPPSAIHPGTRAIGLFFLMSAFAQGCTALTGTEAISNGVPAFRRPEWRNARTTLVWMGALLGSMFVGLSFLASRVGVLPAEHETVLSQIGRTVFGEGPLWGLLQVATATILILAANTAYADFPRLASILARDRYLPRGFQFRGDRLAFSTGIAVLTVLASSLLVIFKGSLDALIPLYAVGVFTSFTLSQSGMVVHWRRVRGRGWKRSAVINGIGAVATAVVTLVIASTKFVHGAWLVIVLIPLFILLLRAIHSHYTSLHQARRAETPVRAQNVVVRAVVPIADLGVEARQALAYARAVAADDQHVVAVHVTDDLAEAEELRRQCTAWESDLPLLVIESQFRSLTGPLVAYIDALREAYPTDTITVVLPELVPSRWWEHLLHNQTALRIKGALLFHEGIVVTNVPYHLARREPPAVATSLPASRILDQ